MLKINHQWNENLKFEKMYFKIIKKKIKRKVKDKNFFWLCNNDGNFNEEKLKKLLFNRVEKLKDAKDFALLFKICELRILLYYDNSDVFEIKQKINEVINTDGFCDFRDYYDSKWKSNNSFAELIEIIEINEDIVRLIKDNLYVEEKNKKVKYFFKEIFKDMEDIFKYDFLYGEITIPKDKEKETYFKIKNDYEKEVEYSFHTLRDEILNLINVKICPYCNRNYVDTIFDTIKNKSVRSFASLDHFFNKDNYPFLALSLYNFIPSCSICNSKFKLSDTEDIINPYLEEFNKECKFIVNHKSVDSLLGLSDDFDIKIKDNNTKCQNNIKLFRLEDIYSNHKYEVKYIYDKYQAYPDCYIEQLEAYLDENNLKNYNGVKEFIYNIPKEEDFINTPLSKFKSDIYDDMEGKLNNYYKNFN